MDKHFRAGFALGLLVLFWGLSGMALQRIGLEQNHEPWRRELFDAVAWALIWTVGGVCYSALRVRPGARGWRATVRPAAIAGAAAGGAIAVTGVIANVVWAEGLTASAVAERGVAVIFVGALSGVIVLGAAHALRAVFVAPMPSNDR